MAYSTTAFAFLLLILALSTSESAREFAIDYTRNTFIMDGEPFQYISGSMHYFRCPSVYWRDRLRKMREAGLNAVSTYAEWSLHEKVPGKYDFSGELNLTEFIRIAAEEDLYVILRPGPYICAERDMGGLPFWLLKKNPDVSLRTADIKYTKYVQRWLDVLMAELQPTLYGNGGPVIMVQVENEYGSYACDGKYLMWLRDLFIDYVGDKAVLFTTDGGATSYLKCGKIPGVYATVDFGPETNVTTAFAAQRKFELRGPLVNSEYYPGWLTHWGEEMAKVDTEMVTDTLKEMLDLGANVNFYMFHGGTNFGFTAGANFGSKYQSDLTSYDYDAPLTEAGDTTPKYYAIRDVILQYFPGMKTTKRTPDVALKVNYGEVALSATASLLSPKMRTDLGKLSNSTYPKSFESLGQNYGYLLYETTVPHLQKKANASVELSVPKISDRAVVFINGVRVGKLSREHLTTKIRFQVNDSDRLSILVENLGRVNYGAYTNDSKGILSNVTLASTTLQDWTMTGFSLDTVAPIFSCVNKPSDCIQGAGFKFYVSKFIISYSSSDPLLPDTFLDVSSLNKGIVYINGNNLGRYWSTRGPQYSLYVPGSFLKKSPEENVMVVLDEEVNSDTILLRFTESHK